MEEIEENRSDLHHCSVTSHYNNYKRRRSDQTLEFTGIEDLRHESLNQILKQNMEMNIDMHLGHGDFDDDDDNNNEDHIYNDLSSQTRSDQTNLDESCCSGDNNNNLNSNNAREKHLIRQHNNNQQSAHDKNLDNIVYNQLIDDERNSLKDDNDDVSVFQLFSIVSFHFVRVKWAWGLNGCLYRVICNLFSV